MSDVPYKLIESDADPDYQSLHKELGDVPILAIDTEFERRSTYFARGSLLQIASENTCYIIDLLAISDFRPLKLLLENNKILKVFHAGYQDYEILYAMDIKPSNCFDTQLGLQFLDITNRLSFESLVLHALGVSVDKSQQCSNWLRRPLRKQQLLYAYQDTRLMYQSYLWLKDRLGSLYDYCHEDCNALIYIEKYFGLNYNKPFFKLESVLTTEEQKILAYMISCYREDEARRNNVPRQKIMSDKSIVKTVEKGSISRDIAAKIKVYSRDDAKEAIALNTERKLILNEAQREQAAAFRKMIDDIAATHNIPSNIIATTKDIYRHILGKKSKLHNGWRADICKEII